MCWGCQCAVELWPPTFQWSQRSQHRSVVPKLIARGTSSSAVRLDLPCTSGQCFQGLGAIPLLPAVAPFPAFSFSASLPQRRRLCHFCWKLVFLLKAVPPIPWPTHSPLQAPPVVEWLRLDQAAHMGSAPTGCDSVQPWVLAAPTCGRARLWAGALPGRECSWLLGVAQRLRGRRRESLGGGKGAWVLRLLRCTLPVANFTLDLSSAKLLRNINI